MKHSEFQIDVIDNETESRRTPNDGIEEINPEPIDWDCM